MHLVYQVRHFVEHAKSLIFCAFTALLRPGRPPKRSESDFEVGQTTKFDKLPINGRDLSSQLSLADISLTNAGMHLLYSAFRRLFFFILQSWKAVFRRSWMPVKHQDSATPEALCTHFIKKYTLGHSFLQSLQHQQYRYLACLHKAAQSLWQEHCSYL